MTASEHAAFVLVAGGLGERLGYSGIKVKLPVDSARNASFLQASSFAGPNPEAAAGVTSVTRLCRNLSAFAFGSCSCSSALPRQID